MLAGRIPELYIAVLGALKRGCVVCPLFSAFGPEPIATRLTLGEGTALVTTSSLYVKKIAGIRAALPALKHVLVARDDWEPDLPAGTLDLQALLEQASAEFETVPTRPEDPALLHFTSGTTGKPKGAVHVHEAVVAHRVTGKSALDFHDDDVFWCTADPGWVTGTSYGIISPLANGITMIVDEADFDAERWYGILQQQKVSVWYTAPTAVRMMMKGGAEAAPALSTSRDLRFIASVGEPLNPAGGVLGRGGLRTADPRQLVADGNRRHHDRQLCGHADQARLHGQAAPRHRGGHRSASDDGAGVEVIDEPGVRGRAGAQARLALDVSRLSPRGGALPQVLRRRTGI